LCIDHNGVCALTGLTGKVSNGNRTSALAVIAGLLSQRNRICALPGLARISS